MNAGIIREMKILHLSKYYHPYRGGIEKVIKELSEAAVAHGHQVTVICANEKNERSEEDVNGVRVVRLPLMLTLFSQPFTPSVFREIGLEVEKCDVVNVHTPNPLFELALLRVKTTKPVVITYHCEVYKTRALSNLYQPISQALLARADRIIVGTTFHIDHSRLLGGFKDKCEIIPFGIAPKYSDIAEATRARVEEIRQKYGNFFLFAGRMVPYKGVDYLLRALVKSESSRVVLIGSGKMLEEWKTLSRQLNVHSRAHFLGGVTSDDEFAAYMHASRALILPSINEAEAFGLVLLEAMSCGKPVITTNLNSGVRFVNKANETGLMVPVMDASRLAEAMEKLKNDETLYAQMAQNAKAHFLEHFLISTCSERYESVYKSLLEAPTKTVKAS